MQSETVEPAPQVRPALAAAFASPPIRRERLIAGCRLAFALCSLLALGLDPTEPKRYASVAYTLVIIYCVYASALAGWLWRLRALPARLPLTVHGIDLALFALIILVTDGPSSPFGVSFVFLLAAAAVRWQQAGTWWTAGVAIGLHCLISLLTALALLDAEFQLNRFLIRFVQLGVVAALLGYVSAYETRLRAVTGALSEWPTSVAFRELLPALLAHAGGILQATCVLLVWEEDEEPWSNLAAWSATGFEWQHLSPEALPGPAPAALADAVFGVMLHPQGARLLRAQSVNDIGEDPIPEPLRARLGDGPVLSVPLRGQSMQGRLFAAGLPELTTDELQLGGILCHQLALRLDQRALFEQFHQEGLSGERISLARDLHDGVIQSLASAALRLETARELMEKDPASASRLIEDIQDLLVTEQRELREFVGQLEPQQRRVPANAPALRERMAMLVQRISRHWNLQVDLHDDFPAQQLPEGLDHQVQCIVLEALVNASRHGRATRAVVRLGWGDQELRIDISDNGHGFPFHGRFDFATLRASRLGPASLKHRVAVLGGRLDIESSSSGACVQIHIPRR